jgi:CRP-like cAMP-binding protein
MFADALKELHELLPKNLIDSCVEIEATKGACLFKAGQKPAHMFFVVSGEVVLERPGLQGTSVILQRTRRGLISEASLKSPKYHCHGQVVANSQIIQIPIREMREAMDSDTAFSGRWINMLNKEVKRLRLQCERLSLTKVQDRFVHLLETEGENGRFPIGAGVKSLAAELGVTHEALYRCIYAMEKAGRLKRSDNYLCLMSTYCSGPVKFKQRIEPDGPGSSS